MPEMKTANKNSVSTSEGRQQIIRKTSRRVKGKGSSRKKSTKGKSEKSRSAKEKKSVMSKPTLPEHVDLDFWHGMLPNADTANLLKEEESFLLRKDMDNSGPILLSVRSGEKVVNCVIIETESGYRIVDREFDTVSALVDYYQVRKISIRVDDMEVRLDHAVRRKAWELRNKMVTVSRELGSGSYGVVYLATLTFPRAKPIMVAAKMLTDFDSEACLALWKEARVMQEYDHPNITKFYGVCNDSMPYYLVMEFIKGGSVDTYLEQNPTLCLFKRAKIAMEAAAGIDYLHSKGCIHRDIAARNLLIDQITKVSDFGLTRKTRNYKVDTEKAMNLRWIAPDVFETSVVNTATDVYAFGITLFEIFVVPYDVPYSRWDADEVFTKVVEQGFRISPPYTAPKDIASLMKECLLEPRHRPTFRMIHLFLLAQVRIMERNPEMNKEMVIESASKDEKKKKKK